MKQRPLVASCYDHLGGILGERLTHRLVELGWVTPEPNPGVTPSGWTGFAQLGLNLSPLMAGRRKPVAFCAERQGGQIFDHVGAHLGSLIQQHFLHSGWLKAIPEGLELTPEGERTLRHLGITLEAGT